ncbi:MAG: 1-deoxy-D-xylulose-5-phosphate synthase [Prevotellaceae bacterium]|nr:1-deoxy-D-xylulose-5-phosphate synthase [Prevotellaceae bacterium]
MEEKESKRLLPYINLPDDLRRLPLEELPQVCEELRQYLIQQLADNPGHFASSLGVVELTVALHYVFNTPEDRIVWDVGHQAYAHKILTGRREAFKTNRKFGGLRPFPSPEESEYDTCTCGHASNSISIALGMAVAAHRTNSQRQVVAVIGDGSMSGGLAFEGLNNVSSTDNDLLVILNDNNMSIDSSVGGFKEYLHQLHTSKAYNDLRHALAKQCYRWGILNDERAKQLLRFNNSVKSLLNRQHNMFEGMNVRYFGPNNGHDVIGLVHTLRQIKDMKGPKMLHIHTVKGKGYAPAEKDPALFHAPGRFCPETGERKDEEDPSLPPHYQTVFGETLLELARRNERIVAVTPAMPSGCGINIMQAELPDRCFDVGIAEGHAVTFSAGMAKDGLLPFCNIYSSFAQRAYDNIIHDLAISRLHVVLCLDRAGLVGEDGPTHHGAFDLAALRPIPGLAIASPMDERELRDLMYTAQLPETTGTFVIRYPRGTGTSASWRTPMQALPIGKGRQLKDGKDVALLSIGPLGGEAAQAIFEAEREENVSVAHFDMRFLRPIDEGILHTVGKRFRQVITLEDGVRTGGLGSAVIEFMAEHGYNPKVTRLGLPDSFVPHGSLEELHRLCRIDKASIKEAILKATSHD